MNFDLPPELLHYIQRLDAFIAAEITPLQNANDNNRFFDHRREFARTDPDTGLPKKAWAELLAEAVRRADRVRHPYHQLDHDPRPLRERDGEKADTLCVRPASGVSAFPSNMAATTLMATVEV